MLNAGGGWYEMTNGGHLMIIKAASATAHAAAAGRFALRLPGPLRTRSAAPAPARVCGRPRRLYAPLQAWQALGQPTIAINANFFDVRGQKGGSWKSTGCSSPLGAYVDNTRGQGRANAAVTGTVAYAGKQGLSGGGESWTSLTTMILPVGGAPYVVAPEAAQTTTTRPRR